MLFKRLQKYNSSTIILIMDDTKIKQMIGLKIKSFRKSKGLTQEELATIIGFEQKNFSRLETGKSLPKIDTVIKMINKAGISPEFLLGFLQKENKTNTSKAIDFEILELLLDLPLDAKKHIRDLIIALKTW